MFKILVLKIFPVKTILNLSKQRENLQNPTGKCQANKAPFWKAPGHSSIAMIGKLVVPFED